MKIKLEVYTHRAFQVSSKIVIRNVFYIHVVMHITRKKSMFSNSRPSRNLVNIYKKCGEGNEIRHVWRSTENQHSISGGGFRCINERRWTLSKVLSRDSVGAQPW